MIDVHIVRDGSRIIGVYAQLEDAESERDDYPKRNGITGTSLEAMIRSRLTLETHRLT